MVHVFDTLIAIVAQMRLDMEAQASDLADLKSRFLNHEHYSRERSEYSGTATDERPVRK